ncbi:MAG: M15 family metallopeptidase [Verrucomicrobiota bacterium]|nr:M15 family metallopeptidase [Verrucomicrobiota bacterium]
MFRFVILIAALASALNFTATSALRGQTAEIPMVNIKTVDPSILVDLRYATEKNVTRRALYPIHMPAMVRATVAERLVAAQKFLHANGYGLKIWDAYRPRAAHEQLWQLTHQTTFVADPNDGVGSLHTRGAAVDATLVDSWGRDVAMPTDFDNFTPAAMLVYHGTNATVRFNLQMLQRAMGRVGFYGLRTEWWHFCAEDWAKYSPVADITFARQTEQMR